MIGVLVGAHPRRQAFVQGDRIWVGVGLFASLLLALLLPGALIVLWSFAERWTPPGWLPQSYTSANWREVMADGSVLEAAALSTLIAAIVTVLTTLAAAPTAWALAKIPLRGRRAIEILVLAPVIVPGVVVAAGVGQVFLSLGLSYTVAGVILVQMIGTLPLMIRMLSANFAALPQDLIHAARSLGAVPIKVALQVVLPLSRPGILAGALLSFVGSFEEFDKTFLVGAPAIQTLPILLYQRLDPYSVELPVAAVVALILLLPVVVIFLIASRTMRDDLLAAGIGKA